MAGEQEYTRRGQGIFVWLRAALFAAFTLHTLAALPLYPKALTPLVALGVAALSFVAPGLGVIGFVVLVSPALAAGDVIAGALFLVIGLTGTKFLADDEGAVFAVVALAFLAARAGVEWAMVPLAGYILGSTTGAVAALTACLALEVAGTLTGAGSLGVTATGSTSAPLLASLSAPEDPLAFGWLGPALREADPQRFLDSLSGVKHIVLLVTQPLVWAIGAAVSGSIRRPPDHPRRPFVGLLAALAGTSVAALGMLAANALFGGPVGRGELGIAAAASGTLALIGVAVWEWVFAPVKRHAPTHGIDADDADVDELLSLIASAEDELASKHTVEATVMITDMKSFSSMTEEDGSVVSAKLVQRHRDLLLPLIEKHRGHGKSTGGDGLVAAFESPADALSAACEMQRSLAEFNASRVTDREIAVRIGVADGEVVLDRRGRPFIGTGLNLAARTMNLGDGGQIMTPGSLIERAGRSAYRYASHGRFELKNIAEPVDIVEILWAEEQTPRPPAVQKPLE